MYNPAHFRITDETRIDAFLQAHSFASLITMGDELYATHLPLFYEEGVFYGHIAKANKHPLGASMVIMQGVDGYISPTLYPSKAETHKVVPTWNYVTYHAWGELEFDDSRDFKHMLVSKLTQKSEKEWRVTDAPESYIEGQLKGIIGLRFRVTRQEFKAKMSQNRTETDRAGVIAGAEAKIAEQVLKYSSPL
jgi:transcriptional regulator